MPLPVLARRVKKMASSQLFNLRLLLNGESSRGFSKFKKSYKLKGELGRGGFGIVYRAVRISDDLPVAVKYIDRSGVKEWAKVNGEQVPMEICMLAKCSKIRGVVRLLDWYSIPEGYLIVMERPYPCIDMFDFIKSQGRLEEDMARFLFRQIVQTVHECAQNKVLHRDLKDENVVIDLVTGSTRVIDFGAATSLRKTQYTDFQGTRLYCPPEWFLHSLYLGREAAVWSLGILLYNSLNGRLPFKNEKDICTSHLLGMKCPFFVEASPEAKDLVHRCLTFDPFKRCTLENILNHPWMTKPTPEWDVLTLENKTPSSSSTSSSSTNTKPVKNVDHLEKRPIESDEEQGSEVLEEVEEDKVEHLVSLKQKKDYYRIGGIQRSDGEESGVGSSASSSKNVKKLLAPVGRLSKTSLLVAPTSGEIKAAVQASKTPTQYHNITTALKPQRPGHLKKARVVGVGAPGVPNSTVLTALRRAMSREAQKKVDVMARL